MGGLSRQVRSERSDTSAAQFRPTAASSGNALKFSRIAFSFAERVFMYHGLLCFRSEGRLLVRFARFSPTPKRTFFVRFCTVQKPTLRMLFLYRCPQICAAP